jgi:hypothetical protein
MYRSHLSAAAVAVMLSAPLGAAVVPFPASFHTQMVPTNGTSLYVRVGGKGPAVVLLHGRSPTTLRAAQLPIAARRRP